MTDSSSPDQPGAPLEPQDLDDLREFIRVQVAAGFAPAVDVVDDAVDVFADTTLAPTALRDAATALAEQAVMAHRAEQASWPATTDCDRLDAAFAALDGIGVVARQHFSCCAT